MKLVDPASHHQRGEDMKMPGYYSKKPVVIQARQYDGTQASADEIIAWTESSPTYAQMYQADVLRIKTLESGEGWHIVSPGDWVIRGIKGEHYPCKPDIFESTYQEERGYPYDRPEHAAPQADAAEGQAQQINMSNDISGAPLRCPSVFGITPPAEPAREAVWKLPAYWREVADMPAERSKDFDRGLRCCAADLEDALKKDTAPALSVDADSLSTAIWNEIDGGMQYSERHARIAAIIRKHAK